MSCKSNRNERGEDRVTLAEKSQADTKKDIRVITGNHAAAHAIRQANVGVVSAYPITPQSPVVEKISEFIEEGSLKAKFVRVESEHSAMAVLCAASATGSRVATATSAHGLELMYEMLPWASGNRLPIVLNLATRALGAPWSVWTDHQDFITVRDVGWIQMICEDNQEIYDSNIQAFKIAEDSRTNLPVMIAYDGYILSHTLQPVIIEPQEEIDKFIPPVKHHINLSDISTIKGVDPVTTPHIREREEGTVPGYYEYRYALQKALENSIPVIMEVHDQFNENFGRSYGNGVYKKVSMEDHPDTVIFAMGSVASQSREALKILRKDNLNIGLVSLRLYRPFPSSHLRELLKSAKLIVVFDRDVGYGFEGVLSYELKASLYCLNDSKPFVKGFIVGLGGRDITTQDIVNGVKKAINEFESGTMNNTTDFIGLQLEKLKNYDESMYFKEV